MAEVITEYDLMYSLSACLVVAAMCSGGGADPKEPRTTELLQSEYYTVTWGTPAVFEPDASLEIGDGIGHENTLGWLRFQPGKEWVEVLSIQFDEGRYQYRSKWPPDRAPVVVKQALLKREAYVALLRECAVISAAKLKPVERNVFTWSTNDFWVYARLATSDKTLLELDWAGYDNSRDAWEFAQPEAIVHLARKAVQGLDFKDHTLTDGERAWASAKFARDWKKYKGLDFHWWVRESYIETIGVVGDAASLPVLSEILAAEPTKEKPWDASDRRCIYLAINAVTRLLKKDVRSKPVEDMDIEKTRLKVLKLLKDAM